MPEIMPAPIRFNHTDPKEVLYSINVGVGEEYVEVVGDLEDSSFEWVIRTPEGVIAYSDRGYGMSDIALRDGLIAYHGLPKDPVQGKPRWSAPPEPMYILDQELM